MSAEARDIVRTVMHLLPGGDAAEELVYRTGLAESGYRTRRQYGGGPARGFWQMEPATERDIWANYIAYRPGLQGLLDQCGERDLEANDYYACAMCRVHYMRVREALPVAGDLEAQAHYWKAHYNTHLGKGTTEHFVAAAERAGL